MNQCHARLITSARLCNSATRNQFWDHAVAFHMRRRSHRTTCGNGRRDEARRCRLRGAGGIPGFSPSSPEASQPSGRELFVEPLMKIRHLNRIRSRRASKQKFWCNTCDTALVGGVREVSPVPEKKQQQVESKFGGVVITQAHSACNRKARVGLPVPPPFSDC